jgi:hypothetical protein
MYSSVSPDNEAVYGLFTRCNNTELYQIARLNGHAVTPNLTKDYLIRIIIGEAEPPPDEHPVDPWRLAIMRFLIEHRRVLETQITCPAKSFQEDACSGCLDAQVFCCLTNNGPDNYRMISQFKK